jgi:hypothetical protein
MSLLLALFLVVHGGIHVGYLCSRSWPFAGGDSWLAAGLGVAPGVVDDVAAVTVLVTFFGFALAALTAVGLLPARLWRPLIVVASVSSAVVLILFFTVGTLPGLAIDAVLLWAVLVRDWRPAPLIGRRAQSPRPLAH